VQPQHLITLAVVLAAAIGTMFSAPTPQATSRVDVSMVMAPMP